MLYETPVEELGQVLRQIRWDRRLASVTVVDNSPTPVLQEIVEASGAHYIFTNRNLGYGAGHNVAMREAIEQSTYHLVCNPDVVCNPEVLQQLKAFMDRNPQVGLVMPKVFYPTGKEQHLCKLLPTPVDLFVRRFAGDRMLQRSRARYELRELDMSATREVPSLSGCFMFLRSSVLQEVGLFDPRYFMYMEDVDLCRRVGEVARTVFYPQVSIEHGYSKGSYRDPKLLRYHLLSAIRYFNKWGWFRDEQRTQLNRRVEVWRERLQEMPRRAVETPRTAAAYVGTRRSAR